MGNQYPINLDLMPEGFTPLASEPVFDPAIHLALEAPGEIVSLAAFGYSADEIAACPSDFAVTDIFRVLSDEGAACLYEVCKQLEAFVASNPRIERCTRGGVYRSRFLRDLCLSPDVTQFLSDITGVDLMPHTIPHQLGHLNYAPKESVGANVDKWHVDTLRFDYVMFVTDPKKNEGGAFQYFHGTKDEMAALRKAGQPLPVEKVKAPTMPGPGYAVMQQGNMVVHQAKGLTKPGERITMVNGYIPADPAFPDYTRYDQLLFADPAEIITAEYSRHVALQCQRLLAHGFDEGDFTGDPKSHADQLSQMAQMANDAAGQLRKSKGDSLEHFGD